MSGTESTAPASLPLLFREVETEVLLRQLTLLMRTSIYNPKTTSELPQDPIFNLKTTCELPQVSAIFSAPRGKKYGPNIFSALRGRKSDPNIFSAPRGRKSGLNIFSALRGRKSVLDLSTGSY